MNLDLFSNETKQRWNITPRGYQQYAVDQTITKWNEFNRLLGVSPTASGKTVTFAQIVKKVLGQNRSNRVLILAHRKELLEQAQDKIKSATGIFADMEKAEMTASLRSRVVIGSIQTVCNRFTRFPRDHFSHIIIDEAHHVVSDQYQRPLDYFGAKELGVTATPDRSDKKSLGKHFEDIAFEISLMDLANMGYIVPPVIQAFPLDIDLSKVDRKSNGDWKDEAIDEALNPYLEYLAKYLKDNVADRKTVCFFPLRKTAEAFDRILKDMGVRSEWTHGDDPDRSKKIETLAKPFEESYQVISNSMLLCLDEKTEILTSKGFVGIDDMTADHRVANWEMDRHVFFEKPKEIVRRGLGPEEYMIGIENNVINLKVTNTHRMIYHKTHADQNSWKKDRAEDVLPMLNITLPMHGLSEPLEWNHRDEIEFIDIKRRIQANSYHLRKREGMGFEESVKEAKQRLAERHSLKCKSPYDLTLDECKLIGFWVADESKIELQSGGVEYNLTQGKAYPFIIGWVDKLLSRLGIDFVRKEKDKPVRHVRWSLPRGTGFGSQKRNGVYSIERYMSKSEFRFLWSLNESQFDAFIEGFWWGDGDHKKKEEFPSSIVVTNTRKNLIETLCSVGCIRSYRCRMSKIPMKNPRHNDQYGLRMIKNKDYQKSYKTEVIEDREYRGRVWCVKTTSKNIITRRNGRVAVMGNTEGFDEPSISCIANFRPTRSRSLYAQIIGRGFRVLPGTVDKIVGDGEKFDAQRREAIAKSEKPNLLVLDPLYLHEDHRLVVPASLVAENEEVARLMRENQRKPGGARKNLFEAAEEAVHEREKALQKALKQKKRKKSKRIDALDYGITMGVQSLYDYEPTMGWHSAHPTKKQIIALSKFGIDADTVSDRGQASILLDSLINRAQNKLASAKQVELLISWGHSGAKDYTYKYASQLIEQRIGRKKK